MQEIKIDTEFIKLDQLLKLADLVSSGAEAHMIITEGKVKVNGETELQKRKKIYDSDIVEAFGKQVKVVRC